MNTYIIANWKLNPVQYKDAKKFLTLIKKKAHTLRNIHTVIAPPPLFLRELAVGNRSKRFLFAAQNMDVHDCGPSVGVVSPAQLHDARVPYVFIGHSDVRSRGEDDSIIQEKVFSALKHNLKPIIFIGEHVRDDEGEFLQAVRVQIQTALKKVPLSKMQDILIVYEPVWAISTRQGDATAQSKVLSAHEIYQMALVIRKVVREQFDESAMKQVTILYGGSVTVETIESVLSVPEISGVVIGSASLDSESFSECLTRAHNFKK